MDRAAHDTLLGELGGHGMGRHRAEVENIGKADLTLSQIS
jgi:hypothetical protein